MRNEAEKETLKAFAVKVNQATIDRWKELKNDGAFETAGQFMDVLLERYANPLKVNKQNEELVRQYKETISKQQAEIEKLTADLKAISSDYEKMAQTAADNSVKMADMQSLLDNTSEALKNEKLTNSQNASRYNGCLAVPVEPLDLMCLQYLADRENKQRKRDDITPEAFFMYCVREMLIKGNKFSINCVPDSVIEKFKKQLKEKQNEQHD